MIKLIQNGGIIRGRGNAIVRKCGCALTRVLLWLMRTPLNHTVAGRKTAIKLGKVVTRVVTDFKSCRKPKHTRVSEADFIGERNRCSTKKLILKPTIAFNSAPKQGPASGYKKGTLRGGAPHPRIGGIPQKYFGVFPRKELVDGPS